MSRRGLLVIALIVLLVGVTAALLRWTQERQAHTERMRDPLFALLQPVNMANCTIERFGEQHDGGYLVCANLLGAVEVGYSYGIAGNDKWGCDVSRRLRVRVHEYDCFDLRRPACAGGDLVFHAECVGSSTSVQEGRPFDTISRQIAKNGDDTKRLVLKIDVEGAEWDSFSATPDEVFERIDQLVVEFHGVKEDRFVSVLRRLTSFFHVVNVHFNNYACDPNAKPFPASAYQVLFVNKRVGVVEGPGTGIRPHPLDTADKRNAPDCQLPQFFDFLDWRSAARTLRTRFSK